MSELDVIFNSIELLYRESTIEGDAGESISLVKKVIELTQAKKGFKIGGGSSEIEDLKYYTYSLIESVTNGDTLSNKQIIQSVILSLEDSSEHGDLFKESMEEIVDTDHTLSTIELIKKRLYNFYTEAKFKNMLSTKLNDLRHHKPEIGSVSKLMDGLKVELEELSKKSKQSDEAIIDEIDISDKSAVEKVAADARDQTENGLIFKTGWKDLNKMTHGGLRRGEFVSIGALQHNYKTGFSLSVFVSMLLYNTPKLKDPNKKPLFIWISLEDPLKNILEHIYVLLKMNDGEPRPNLQNIELDSIVAYVQDKLQEKGFNVKFLRVNPSEWSYSDLLNKLMKYDNDGFEVMTVGMDYLYLMPTTGCITGPAGIDYRDLVRRVRFFCASRDILFISPVQLSTDAKALMRADIPPFSFVKDVADKGYYSNSKQLDQEFDLGILISKAVMNNKTYLTVQREKHKIIHTVPEDDKYFILEFPKLGAIVFDVDKPKKVSFRNLDAINSNASENDFDF